MLQQGVYCGRLRNEWGISKLRKYRYQKGKKMSVAGVIYRLKNYYFFQDGKDLNRVSTDRKNPEKRSY